MTKYFAPKLLSQGSIELNNLSKNVKNFRFGGVWYIILISVLNFSAESAVWDFFFCNYYWSKWYQKHRICNWLVEENKFGAATF